MKDLSCAHWMNKATDIMCKTYSLGAVQYIEYIESQEKLDSSIWYRRDWRGSLNPQYWFLRDRQFAVYIQPRCGCASIWIRSAFAMTSIVAVRFCPAILIPMPDAMPFLEYRMARCVSSYPLPCPLASLIHLHR